jgi:hypothetical protein
MSRSNYTGITWLDRKPHADAGIQPATGGNGDIHGGIPCDHECPIFGSGHFVPPPASRSLRVMRSSTHCELHQSIGVMALPLSSIVKWR